MKRLLILTGVVLAVGLPLGVLLLLYNLPLDLGPREPAQPLAFSHQVHAGANAIHCLYCHRGATVSPVAGIPAVDDCRACHQFIAADRPEVKKVLAFAERKEAIPWVRVHDLPDHVYFPHMLHVRAGLTCNACHGEVAAMERTRRVANLKMGWCLECHRQKGASIDCWACHI
jgi:hypothetical protein